MQLMKMWTKVETVNNMKGLISHCQAHVFII